jgi:hypothetical protein
MKTDEFGKTAGSRLRAAFFFSRAHQSFFSSAVALSPALAIPIEAALNKACAKPGSEAEQSHRRS